LLKEENENNDNFSGLMEKFKKLEQKLLKYRSFSKDLAEKIKTSNNLHQLIASLKLFVP